MNTDKFRSFFDSLVNNHYDYKNPEYVIEELKKYNKRNNQYSSQYNFEGLIATIKFNSSSTLKYNDPKFEELFINFLLSDSEFQSFKNDFEYIDNDLQRKTEEKIYEIISLYEKIRDDNSLYISDYHLKTIHQIFYDFKCIESHANQQYSDLNIRFSYCKVDLKDGKFYFVNELNKKINNDKKIIGCGIFGSIIILICAWQLALWILNSF